MFSQLGDPVKHCLIVDNSDVVRKVARRILEDNNITSSEAENADAALDFCKAALPDLILLDWHMPGMNPLDFVMRVRGAPEGEFPRIIYCVTELEPESDHRAMAAGANALLLKPFDRRTLTAQLRELGALTEM